MNAVWRYAHHVTRRSSAPVPPARDPEDNEDEDGEDGEGQTWEVGTRVAASATHSRHPRSTPRGQSEDDDARVAPSAFITAATTIADLLAPDAVDLGRDYVRLDGIYARTLILTGYPARVSFGWLGALLWANEVQDVSLHLYPQDARQAQRVLSRTMVQLQSSRLASSQAGRLENVETEVAYGHCEDLRERLQRGDDRVLTAGLYVTLYGTSPEELEARTVRVETLIGTLMGQTRRATWQALSGLKSTLPGMQSALHSRHTARTLDTSTLATMFPFACSVLQMDGGVLYGLNTENNSLVVVDAFSPTLFNYNQCVVATSGAGKSYTVKLLVLRTLPLGVQTLVIDPVGEYVHLASALGGQVVRLSAGSPHRINPLDLPPPQAPAPGDDDGDEEEDFGDDGGEEEAGAAHDVLAAHCASVHGLLDILLAGEGNQLTQAEKAALDSALRRCYARAGITADPQTHSRRAPTLHDVRDELRALHEPYSLAERMDLYCGEGSLGGLVAGPTTVHLQGRLIVFDLHDLARELQAAAMYLLGQHIWAMAARAAPKRRPIRLIIDEAQVLTGHAAGGRLLEDCARRGRKHFVGVTAISQDVRDFLATKPGQAMLTNSALRILLRQDESTLSALDEGLHLTPQERSYLVACPRGEALLAVQGQRVPLRIEASPHEHLLCTTDPHEQGAWSRTRKRRSTMAADGRASGGEDPQQCVAPPRGRGHAADPRVSL